MATDPRQVRAVLQATETHFQGFVEPIEAKLQATARAIDSADKLLDEVGTLHNDNNKFKRLRHKFNQTVRTYLDNAREIKRVIQQDIPTACQWLRERDQALSKFDQSDIGLPGASQTESSGISRDTERLITLGKAAMATGNPTLLNTFFAALDRMGSHGSVYQQNHQQFLRNLVDDLNQPRYVRGWIRQELNRVEQVKKAKAEGSRPPGRTSKQIKGIPGLDVGHRFPELDLVENFRLELASMNRRRYWIAKRLGIEENYR